MAATNAPQKGVAGRIDYDSWEKRTSDLTKQLEDEEEAERKESASVLGLDGRHARSKAEAEEQAKAKEAEETKKMLDSYQKREVAVIAQLESLLGPVNHEAVTKEEKDQETKYVTRDMLDAGKRLTASVKFSNQLYTSLMYLLYIMLRFHYNFPHRHLILQTIHLFLLSPSSNLIDKLYKKCDNATIASHLLRLHLIGVKDANKLDSSRSPLLPIYPQFPALKSVSIFQFASHRNLLSYSRLFYAHSQNNDINST